MTPSQYIKITTWQRETFPKATALSDLRHLRKEVNELIDAIEMEAHDSDIQSEFADCFILLFGSAKKIGFDFIRITEVIEGKFNEVKTREWGEPDNEGITEHIKS